MITPVPEMSTTFKKVFLSGYFDWILLSPPHRTPAVDVNDIKINNLNANLIWTARKDHHYILDV